MRIVEEGQIKNNFDGFKDEKTTFEMLSGSKWIQAEYKYSYHSAFMPKVKITEDMGNYYLEVENMNDKVLVKKI